MNIKIKNLRNEKPTKPWDVRVDRFNKILGNPFYMANENERNKVCDKYRTWIQNKINNKDKLVIQELIRLKQIHAQYRQLNLFCWCAPKRCHAEEIQTILELM